MPHTSHWKVCQAHTRRFTACVPRCLYQRTRIIKELKSTHTDHWLQSDVSLHACGKSLHTCCMLVYCHVTTGRHKTRDYEATTPNIAMSRGQMPFDAVGSSVKVLLLKEFNFDWCGYDDWCQTTAYKLMSKMRPPHDDIRLFLSIYNSISIHIHTRRFTRKGHSFISIWLKMNIFFFKFVFQVFSNFSLNKYYIEIFVPFFLLLSTVNNNYK